MKLVIKHKAFEDRTILKDIEFSLEEGRVSVLCGPSGCGKTTIMRILTGLDTDFEGHVELNDQKLGFVFQEPHLLPWRTVCENISVITGAKDSFIDELLGEVGLSDMADVMASKLSLGMARRVSIARALAVKPDVLVLDEPFVSLDPDRVERLRKLTFGIIQKYHLKALFVTHQPAEAVQMAHDIHILSGQPTQISKTVEVGLSPIERFNSTFVQAFLDDHKGLFAFS